MYSFNERDDCVVLDEPLYGSWLARTSAAHKGADLVIADAADKGCLDENEAIAKMLSGALDGAIQQPPSVRFLKNMAKFISPENRKGAFLLREDVVNVFLIRDPHRGLHSYGKVESLSMAEIGWDALTDLVSFLESEGKPVYLLDAKLLALDPEGVLQALCAKIGIDWKASMLEWPSGPRPEIDIKNAHMWYDTVWKSTCFLPYKARDPPSYADASPEICALVAECELIYDQVKGRAIRRDANRVYVGLGRDTHDLLPDQRNANIHVWVGDKLVPRAEAKVSVFDSSVQNGDHVWEGLRIYEGRIFALHYHLDRLYNSAKALFYENIPSRASIENAIFATLEANGMRDGVHIRLTLTRGEKVTSSMNPLFNRLGCTLIVLAEYKDPVYNESGIRLVTSSVRRNTPAILDSKIHHGNMLHLVLAKIQANLFGADDAVMLDVDGFVAETNATNIFAVIRKDGHAKGQEVLVTPLPDACLNGITRQIVLEIARASGMAVEERRVSLSEFHSAKEVFTTGTMGELSPVTEIDGRVIGHDSLHYGEPQPTSYAERFPVTARLQKLYQKRWEKEGIILPF